MNARDKNLGGLSRRQLLQAGVAGLTLAVTAQGKVWAATPAEAKKYGADSMPGGTVDDPLVFVSIADSGVVTIIAHRVEMGTGVRTSLPMVVADEMEAKWDMVQVQQAEANEARYGNQNVDGSRSMRHFFMPMRRVGAAARQMLEAAAAAQWGVPVAQVKAVQHEVVHSASGRRLGYGALAQAAAKLAVPPESQRRLKKESEFRYIGKSQVRMVDLEAIGKGQAKYGMDQHMPGMVYAVVARPGVLGVKLRSFNGDKAMQVPGVLKLVEIPMYQGAPAFSPLGGVAVVARNTWAAMQGRKALELTWEDSPHTQYDSASYRQTLEKAARAPGKSVRNEGDVAAVWGKAKPEQRLTAEYYIPTLAHASMEPPVATALVKDGQCEIWTSSQDPQTALNYVAKALGLPPEKVKVQCGLLGGGFGRKSKCDYVVEAALVAQAMPGTPVKLVWTREDDIQHDYYHAVAVEHLEAAIGKKGLPDSWLHRTVSPTISSLFDPNAQGESPMELGMGAINMPYRIPNVRIETGNVPAHSRIGWFRSVYNIPHAFATQCFIAELAHHAGKDHKQYALDLIGPARKLNPEKALADAWNYSEDPERYPYDTGRLRDVIEAATRGAGWGRKLPKGRGLGLAFSYSFVTYAATVVEVEVDDKGQVKVLAVDMALDCGPQVNPERIRSQMEGSAVMGIGIALMSEISFDKGQCRQSNFHDYEVLRHNASPPVIRTHLVNNHLLTPPGGVGEPPLPPVAPAVCNAIFAATGVRVRDLPVRQVKRG